MKKVLSLVLAVVLVFGLTSVAFASGTTNNANEIKDLNTIVLTIGESGSTVGEHTGYDQRPDDTVTLYLNDINGNRLTREQVRYNDLDVQIRATEGGKIIDSYKIKYDRVNVNNVIVEYAKVEVDFIKKFVSVDSQDYEIFIYLTAKNRRVGNSTGKNDYIARLIGEFENYYTEVDEYDDMVYVYDAPVVKALDYVKNIEVDLGQNISIFAKMFEDKNYYGYVSQEIKEADEGIVAKYPDIQTIYYLETIGLSSTGDVVSFHEKMSDNYYVYVQNADGDLVYIGRTNDRLPYFTKYFLSIKELAVDAGLEDLEDITPEEGGPDAGGDGPALENVNENPSTGR